MRERKTFGQRSRVHKNDSPNKKFFLVCEGEKTEFIYFDRIKANSSQLNISPLIEIIPVVRSYSEKGFSNPKKIMDCFKKNIDEQETGIFSYETILCNIMDYLHENNLFSKTEIKKLEVWDILKNTIESKGLEMTDRTGDIGIIYSCFNEVLRSLNLGDVLENIEEIMDNSKISYEKDFDKICFIVDRDEKSFKEDQYDEVLKICDENNYSLYVTNPCFEFWLLMHYDDVMRIDREKIRRNEAISKRRRFLDNELSSLLNGYNKSKYRADEIVLKVDVAIKNEKNFCEDITTLKNEIGSNIGLLIEELRRK